MNATIWIIVGASIASVSIWLTVRVINRKERLAKRALAGMIVIPVLYLAGFGPACWLTSLPPPVRPREYNRAMILYLPFGRIMSGDTTPKALQWWMGLGVTRGCIVTLPAGINTAGINEIVQVVF